MKTHKISDFTKGWFIGNFSPSLLVTSNFEVGLLTRDPGEETPHVHRIATEYNVLVTGSMNLSGKELISGDVFIIEANEWVHPIYHTPCTILCVKTPSIPNDKYTI